MIMVAMAIVTVAKWVLFVLMSCRQSDESAHTPAVFMRASWSGESVR